MLQLLADMFSHGFMTRAFIAGVVLGAAIPLVGVVVVLKRLSMVGDALSHASLAGVAAGLIGGINPVAGATVACVAAALAIEGIRRRFEGHADLAIAVVMATGVGLAGVLSGFTPNSSTFSSFLFGSIVTVGDDELAAVVVLGVAVAALCLVFRRELFWVTIDERAARLAGVRVTAVNFAFILITAVAVSIASRTVGTLIVSSMMTVPVACALVVARSWRQTIAISCAVGVMSAAAGLVASYVFGFKPGGAIVLAEVTLLLVFIAVKAVGKRAS
ncbi:metal ABC transporter permease [uncultured Senegalimassilia sp.]|uniref:metal ABC transporter permease n=1 Tax=uncultured Senegalimassilia sp. TaxID=1714350 RepID=UPI0025E04D4C|nr:metal ABC transporter permease [uncultured Senegalimassilia sp.]